MEIALSLPSVFKAVALSALLGGMCPLQCPLLTRMFLNIHPCHFALHALTPFTAVLPRRAFFPVEWTFPPDVV